MPSPRLSKSENAFLAVIDVQEKLAAAMPAKYLQGNLVRLGKLVKAAVRLHIPIVVTEQYRKGLGATLPVVSNEIQPFPAPIEKTAFDCCDCPEFTTWLADLPRREAILIGMETHICVLQTALNLHSQGYRVVVVEDACLSRYDEDHKSAIQLLRTTGIVVTTFEALLYAWIEKAATPAFKDLSFLSRDRDY